MFWFIFLTTHTENGHGPHILLPGIIDYNFVQYTKSEGKCTETFKHTMVKVRRYF